MKASLLKSVLFIVVLLVAAPTWAEEPSAGLSEATQAGIGCLVASSAAMTASLLVGPSELLMIAAGGLLVPSSATPLLVGLTATIVVASCSVGSAATPVTLWFAEQIGITSANSDAPKSN